MGFETRATCLITRTLRRVESIKIGVSLNRSEMKDLYKRSIEISLRYGSNLTSIRNETILKKFSRLLAFHFFLLRSKRIKKDIENLRDLVRYNYNKITYRNALI